MGSFSLLVFPERAQKKRGTLIVTCSRFEAFELAHFVETSNEDPRRIHLQTINPTIKLDFIRLHKAYP